ncbi:MAG: aldose epimerase [Pedobacter sp.]|jgi:galactose mutarotase-like enzyme|nr:aldose epimerase [Pedobacter sp.]
MIILENENLIASFSARGAELQSLKSKFSNTEYIWAADPKIWAKHSPVLFPIVGALKENKYIYKEISYELPRHGFARELEFEVEPVNATEVVFTLRQSEETLALYPFAFQLSLRYTLSEYSLTCSYEVLNPGDQDMLFSIGGHPAFATPVNGSKYSDYQLTFNAESELRYHKVVNNLISDETIVLPLENQKLTLKHELFYKDALVFKSLKSDKITLTNKVNQTGLEFSFEGFPYFGIWAAKDADFICLEPWCGIADGTNHNQHLRDKEGIITLAAKQSWGRAWTVKIILPA